MTQKIFSDNAKNFVSADRKLCELQKTIMAHSKEAKAFAAEEGLNFIFIPTNKPNIGRLWEAAVKIVKHLVFRAIGSALLTVEECSTTLAEGELS